MSKRGLHVLSIDLVNVHSDIRCASPVPSAECRCELVAPLRCEGSGIRDSDTTKILGLKTKVSSPHSNSIALNKKLSYGREENPSKHLEIPDIGLHEVEGVVRIGFTPIQDWIEFVLDVGNVKLRFLNQRMCDAINRAIPIVGVFY